MLDQALSAFDLTPDVDLGIMRHGQTLTDVTTAALAGLAECFGETRPDLVLAQGDTTTTFCAGLAAFYLQIPFGHVEAGLRTESIWNPFPEEFNRRAVGLFARHHYAPTHAAAANLEREGTREGVFVTGNTGIDAVLQVAEARPQTWFVEDSRRILLLTTHRRENWGEPQASIARAARRIVEEFEDVLLVVPMHRNPQVRETLQSILGDHPSVRLIEPPGYADFVKLMQRSTLILTDSGGVQEEAPAFGKPVLVLRTTTERPEGVEAGSALLVGTEEDKIAAQTSTLLMNDGAMEAMSRARSPYGDGVAARRIRYLALRMLEVDSAAETMWT